MTHPRAQVKRSTENLNCFWRRKHTPSKSFQHSNEAPSRLDAFCNVSTLKARLAALQVRLLVNQAKYTIHSTNLSLKTRFVIEAITGLHLLIEVERKTLAF
jgi:hypothetical protein